ncbi:glutamyl aminopeptidase-like [Temnothorax nylanderi]|uniref:glutamyl aminopeptidase-like n=1 Tax=Temnothorax nylanderi TaxID=102681 RepID=UPI003A89E359
MDVAQISSSLIFIITITALTGEELNNSSVANHFRLPSHVVPVHYNIKLNLSLEKYDSNMTRPSYTKQEYGSFLFDGISRITINILQSTRNIKLHALHTSDIKDCLIERNGVVYNIPKKFISSFETNVIGIDFSDILSPGLYILAIVYEGRITDNNAKNFYRSSYIEKDENLILIAPHIQEVGARRLFPCWDEPHLKATFNISIKHYCNFTAISNMPIRNNYVGDDGLMWTHFQTTPPMSTYQVSVSLTNFPHIQINKNICLYAKRSSLQSLKYAEQVIKNITLHLESKFNEIKIPKMDHIVIPHYLPDNGMSKWGLVFHREADLICEDKLDSIMRKIEIARSIASKIAYQWLGNVITPSWWSHFWLHEGLAILFGEDAVVKFVNNSQMMDLFIVQSQYDSLHLDSHFDMNPPQIYNLSQIDLIFSFPRYIKEIVVLRMLQNTVTDEVFRNGVRTCLHKYKFSSLTVNEFWFGYYFSDQYHISHDFLKWIIYQHYPIIKWTQEIPFYGLLTQYFNGPHHCSYGKWWIPISLMTKSSLKGSDKKLTPQNPSLPVIHAKDDWIMVDIRQAGYYRVNYDMENLRKISLYLNSKEYKSISVINRAKIIDDAFHFLLTRQINATEFWALAKYLTQETDYVAWYPMLKVFEYISSVLPLSKYEINFIHIKETMGKILTKPLEILGCKELSMEKYLIKCLRQEIAKWACTVELSECLQMAQLVLEEYLQNTTLNKITPYWKKWAYCNNFRTISAELITGANLTRGKIIIWPDIVEEYQEYITCFKDDLAINYIFYTLWYEKSARERQNGTKRDIKFYINIFNSFIVRHATNEIFLKRILSNIDSKPPEISTTAALINIINHIYNTTVLDKLNIYLKDAKLIDLGQIASKVYSKIKTRISEIERHIRHLDMLLNYTFELKEPGGKRSSNEDLLTDTCANYFVMSNGAMSNVPVVSEQSLHAHQKPAVPKMIDVKDGAGDSATALASYEDDTCDSDFTTSTSSRDYWTLRRVSNEVQQSCVSCLSQNLPTELPSSTSPRNYKDLKEKCPRFSLAAYGEKRCDARTDGVSGETFQDSSLKRRTFRRKDQKTPRPKFSFWIEENQSRRIQ